MFYDKEDVQPAVSAATQLFGAVAQYHPTPFTYLAIETPKYGKIWYGDVSSDTPIREKCENLAKTLGEPITALDMGTNYPLFNITP